MSWFAVEKDVRHVRRLRAQLGRERVRIGDARYLHVDQLPERPSVAITNPPFNQWWQLKDSIIPLAPITVMLLALDMLGSATRHTWMQQHVPDVITLPERIAFTGGSGTDSNYYAWFIWYGMRPRRSGRVQLLDLTPSDERRATRRKSPG